LFAHILTHEPNPPARETLARNLVHLPTVAGARLAGGGLKMGRGSLRRARFQPSSRLATNFPTLRIVDAVAALGYTDPVMLKPDI